MVKSMEETSKYVTFSFRWTVLGLFMFVNVVTQMIWITYAAIDTQAATVFNVSVSDVDILALVFMIVYLPMNFPASWIIDKYGLKWGTGFGVILIGVFGFLRGLTTNFMIVLICQIVTAVGQPFVLNSFTKVAGNWFPEKDKALATGLGTMSMMLGIVIAMFLAGPIYSALGLYWLGMIYGILSLVAMVLYILFVKDKPPTPANPNSEKVKVLMVQGLKDMFKNRDFQILLILLFIGYGAFNAILSAIGQILPDSKFISPHIANVAGIIGAIVIIGGLVGSVVMPAISDKIQKRKPFILIAAIAGVPLTILFGLITSFSWLAIESIIYGFLLVAALPIGLTFAAEITYPVPEESSNGIIIWIAQIGGIVFLFGFIFEAPGYMLVMYIIAALFAVAIIVLLFMHDKDFYKKRGATTPVVDQPDNEQSDKDVLEKDQLEQ
jgi:nitrate/nitrite transporter NarK